MNHQVDQHSCKAGKIQCLTKKLMLVLVSASLVFLVGCEQIMIMSMNSSTLTELKVKGDKLYLMGIINAQSFEQVKVAVDKNPQLNTLVLTVMPGSIDDETNLEMCHFIRNQGLSTYLQSDSVVASGAVDLFMSGVRREMEKGAQIGVHSWSDGYKEALDYPRNAIEHKPYRDFYQAMVGSDEFYWYTLEAAKADDIHWMSLADIEKHQMLTAAVREAGVHSPVFAGQAEIRADMLRDD